MKAETRKKATAKVLRRIAKEKIKRFNLTDTPDEYINKTISQSFLKKEV